MKEQNIPKMTFGAEGEKLMVRKVNGAQEERKMKPGCVAHC
jgi:hypothetical protein